MELILKKNYVAFLRRINIGSALKRHFLMSNGGVL